MKHISISSISLCLLLVLFAGGCSWFRDTPEDPSVRSADAANATNATIPGAEVPYTPVIEGEILELEDDDAREKLTTMVKGAAEIFTLQEKLPPTLNMLRRRGEDDLPRVRSVLQGVGRFDSRVFFRVRTPEDGEALPKAVLTVRPGPPYTVDEVEVVHAEDDAPLENMPPAEELGLATGEVFDARKAVDVQDAIIQELGRTGHPFPKVSRGRVTLDHEDRTAALRYTVTPGPEAVFGPARIEGLERTDPEFVTKMLPWDEGDPYNAELLDEARERIFSSGVFAAAVVAPSKELEEGGKLPIELNLAERPPRTLKFGLRYDTDIGPGVTAGWVHRNMWGAGEHFESRIKVNPVVQELTTRLRKPFFLRDDQEVILQGRAANESTDAYDSMTASVSGVVERTLFPGLAVGAGLGYRFAVVEDQETGDKSGFSLLFVPTYLRWETVDSVLNPTSGGRLNVAVTPFQEVGTGSESFVKVRGSYAHYVDLWSPGWVVLAGRAAAGSIFVDRRDGVPADELFYAGGGGSVRGIPYQLAGPLDGDDPVGGLSFVETAAELRFKFTETIGAATFVDAGRAYRDWDIDTSKKLFFGWGLGLRYYTDFGPIRADVAFPLDKRKGIDRNFEIYMSLGQAF